MSSFRIRPRFAHVLELPPSAARQKIMAALAAHAPNLEVRDFPDYLGLHFPEAQRKLWTPRLALHFEPTPSGTTEIHGLYGPEADLWSIFLYGYILSGTAGTFAGIFGFAQWYTHDNPWGLWVLAAMGVVAALMYLAAQLGQKLGAWQTFELHQAYQRAIGRPTEIE